MTMALLDGNNQPVNLRAGHPAGSVTGAHAHGGLLVKQNMMAANINQRVEAEKRSYNMQRMKCTNSTSRHRFLCSQ